MKVETVIKIGKSKKHRDTLLHTWSKDYTLGTFTVAFQIDGKVIKLELSRDEAKDVIKRLQLFVLETQPKVVKLEEYAKNKR